MPFSKSESSDDVWWTDCSAFLGKEVVATEKIDGECTTIYEDAHLHARSVDAAHHPSRSYVKQIAARIAHDIPKNHRICGENVFAYHSIFYTDLPSYFLVYGIYDGDRCLSWTETEELCHLLDLHTVPVLYRGVWDEKAIRSLWTGKGTYPTYETTPAYESRSDCKSPKFPEDFQPTEAEGYVIRIADEFGYDDFSKNCAKWVRQNHVRTSEFWRNRPVVPNLLAG